MDTWLDGRTASGSHVDVAVARRRLGVGGLDVLPLLRAAGLPAGAARPGAGRAAWPAARPPSSRCCGCWSTWPPTGECCRSSTTAPTAVLQALQELLEVCVLGRQLVELPGLEQRRGRHPRRAGSGRDCTLEDQLRAGSPDRPSPAPPDSRDAARLGGLRRRRAPGPALGRGRGRPWSTPDRTAAPTGTWTSWRSTSTATARSGSPRPACRRTAARCATALRHDRSPTRPSGSTATTRPRRRRPVLMWERRRGVHPCRGLGPATPSPVSRSSATC